MPSIKPKINIKKKRRQEQSQANVARKKQSRPIKSDSDPSRAKAPDFNVVRLVTLESYKKVIAKVCSEAVSNPENGFGGVFKLFDIVALKGGGTDELKAYVKNLALRSLVAVTTHLIPRISYELLEEGGQDADGNTNSVSKKKEKASGNPKVKGSTASSLVEVECTISKNVVQLRDRLVDYCAQQLQTEPHVIVPMIARLTSADAKPQAKLLKLCMQCCNLEDEALIDVCLENLKEVMDRASISDLEKALKIILDENNVHAGVLRIINGIPIIKRQHSFEILNEKSSASNKHVEELLVTVITFYLRILANCKGDNLDECLNGLARYGVLVNEVIQKEILGKMKSIMQKANTLRPFTHVRVLQAATMLTRSLNVKSDWIIQEFTRIIPTTAPYLCQGQTLEEGDFVRFSEPCYTRDIIKTIHVVAHHAISSCTVSGTEDLVRFVQEVIGQALISDSAVAQAIVLEVCRILQKTPKIVGILDTEGIVFSVLSKRATSFWEIELLLSHVCPEIALNTKNLKHHSANGSLDRLKLASDIGRKGEGTSKQDALFCGYDINEILMCDEADMFSKYKPAND